MTKKIITRAQVDAYNALAETFKGTDAYHKFVCCNEWLNGKRWVMSGYYLIRKSYLPRTDEEFYIKKVGEYTYLYYENINDKERYLLSDIAEAIFTA